MTRQADFNNFSDNVDAWTRLQYRRAQKHFNIAYIKTARFTRKVIEHDWKNEAYKVESIYYANKALFYGASQQLPFKTLCLLGKLLGEKPVREDIKQIIKSNVIKFNGQFFKLDDLDKQTKVRKILRTYQFDQFEKQDIAA